MAMQIQTRYRVSLVTMNLGNRQMNVCVSWHDTRISLTRSESRNAAA
jgi:hypothetical protein